MQITTVGLDLAKNVWAAAGSVDTDLSFLSFLKVYRTDVADGRMTPRLNVQHEWKIVCAALNLRRMNVLRMA